jgi:hypothetical protein
MESEKASPLRRTLAPTPCGIALLTVTAVSHWARAAVEERSKTTIDKTTTRAIGDLSIEKVAVA